MLKACAGSQEALEDLSRSYWPAVYAFLRRKGFAPQDAEDLTQDTFASVLQGGRLAAVDSKKGRFRSFLCACADHEASHFRKRNEAEKRGANRIVSLEALDAEQHYQLLPVTDAPTETVFDRAWSKIIVSRALEKLNSDYERLEKNDVFQALLPLLQGGTERGDFRIVAEKLGLTEVNARVTWLRFKTSFIGHLRSEVAETVADASEVDEELRYLVSAWLSAAT
ncbi:MAG: sigma-70 family RNA polymerase sigma factor [Verrucomicrobiota bacterium]